MTGLSMMMMMMMMVMMMMVMMMMVKEMVKVIFSTQLDPIPHLLSDAHCPACDVFAKRNHAGTSQGGNIYYLSQRRRTQVNQVEHLFLMGKVSNPTNRCLKDSETDNQAFNQAAPQSHPAVGSTARHLPR